MVLSAGMGLDPLQRARACRRQMPTSQKREGGQHRFNRGPDRHIRLAVKVNLRGDSMEFLGFGRSIRSSHAQFGLLQQP